MTLRRSPLHACATFAIWASLVARYSLAFAPASHCSPPIVTSLTLKRRARTPVLRAAGDSDEEILSPGDNLRRLRRAVIARRRRAVTNREDEARGRQDFLLTIVALAPCLLAFFLWDEISLLLARYIDAYGVLGTTPDGGAQFTNNILRPTITGVLVPVISIALATLVSTTVNVLRERQVEIRSLVNKEACDLRLLRRAIFGMFGTRQHAGRRAKALALLAEYTEQVDGECRSGAIEKLEELELSGGIAANELDRLSAMMHGVDGAAASRQGTVDAADAIVSRLNAYRSDRVALLLTDFPELHWVVLIALSVGITVIFLLESNQLADQWLNSIQLRSLFALLVGVFSATATLTIDLDDPFIGSFSIAKAAMQVGDLRLCLQEDLREANAEAGEVSSSTPRFFRSFVSGPSEGGAASNSIEAEILARDEGDSAKPSADAKRDNEISAFASANRQAQAGRNRGRRPRSADQSRYGFLPTIYFHLLTGPMGGSVRVLGDIAAWLTTIAVKRTKASVAWVKSQWRWRRRESA